MTRCRLQALLLVVLLMELVSPHALWGQAWSGILDPTRAIDWSNAGIPGGIPNRTTVCATLSPGATVTQINSAISSCPANQVVFLNAGTYNISGGINLKSNVTLRGAGPTNTILNATGSGSAVINIGSGDVGIGGSVNITSGATAGSTSITLSSASGVTVGSYLMITELNDSSYVTITTPNGTCTWCDGGTGFNGTRVRGQIVEVTSVSGTTVGITPGLYSAYSLTPLATPFAASVKNAGAENLQVYANNTGYSTNFLMSECAYCWLKNVEGNYTDGDAARVSWSYRVVVRDSYFSNAYLHAAGNSDSDLFIVNKTSASLFENNILERLHVSVMLNWGPAGNVVAYNYSMGNFDDSATNVALGDFSTHGAHPQFNLFEGNVGGRFWPDSFWGSSSHNTAFRNWWTGTWKIAPYINGTYSSQRNTINWTGAHYAFQQTRGIDLSFPNTRYNLVGNVSGSAAVASVMTSMFGSGPAACAGCLVAPTNRNYEKTFYPFSFGYDTGADTSGSGVPAQWVGQAYATALIHGNYDTASNAIAWSGAVTHTLPASFYLASKPAWFGTTPWPAIGPDVTGGIDGGGHVYKIPAEVCYDSTVKNSTGILLFDATACYGGTSSGVAPAPPTNLTVTVR